MEERRFIAYEEITPAPLWVLALVWVACTVAAFNLLAAGGPLGVLALALPIAFHALFGYLRVSVTRTSLLVGFGWTGWIRRLIEFRDIESMEAIEYRPLLDFGGWGIRWRPGKTAWTISGNQALRLKLVSGQEVYVGSEEPSQLAHQIRLAWGRNGDDVAGEDGAEEE